MDRSSFLLKILPLREIHPEYLLGLNNTNNNSDRILIFLIQGTILLGFSVVQLLMLLI